MHTMPRSHGHSADTHNTCTVICTTHSHTLLLGPTVTKHNTRGHSQSHPQSRALHTYVRCCTVIIIHKPRGHRDQIRCRCRPSQAPTRKDTLITSNPQPAPPPDTGRCGPQQAQASSPHAAPALLPHKPGTTKPSSFWRLFVRS